MPQKARDAFRTISEVANWLDIPAHVLRFWESKFSQIKPVKRAGGRRYYRPADMQLIGGIKKLLHDDGLTIRGVQKMLKEDGIKAVSAYSPPLDMPSDEEAAARRQARRARRKTARDKATTPTEVKQAEAPEAPFINVETSEEPDNVVAFAGRDAEETAEVTAAPDAPAPASTPALPTPPAEEADTATASVSDASFQKASATNTPALPPNQTNTGVTTRTALRRSNLAEQELSMQQRTALKATYAKLSALRDRMAAR